MTRILYFIRHGQLDTEAFAENPRTAGLTSLGRQQAHLTAKRLRNLDVCVVHCSTLKRALETAQIIARQFPAVAVRTSKLLREIPGPESVYFCEEKARADHAFAKYCRPTRGKERTELVICHGNLIRRIAYSVLGIAAESWPCLGTSHCGITHVEIADDGKMRLVSYNDTGHLPARLRS